MEEIKVQEKIQIKQFIEDHYQLITIIGVFGALTALFISSKSTHGAFFSLMIFLLLSWELWIHFPKHDAATLRLQMFEFFFMGLVLSVSTYILKFVYIDNKELILLFDIYVIFTVYIMIFLYLLLYSKFPERVDKIAPENKRYGPIIRAFVFIVIFALILGLAYLTSYAFKTYIK